MSEVVCALGCVEAGQEGADATAKAALRSLGGLAQIRLPGCRPAASARGGLLSATPEAI
jgi:hypothetical protein